MWFLPGGPRLDTTYRPSRTISMGKLMPNRPPYPGMMPGMPGTMTGMMGLDQQQYKMGPYKQPPMAQGQMLRQQLQAKLVRPGVNGQWARSKIGVLGFMLNDSVR